MPVGFDIDQQPFGFEFFDHGAAAFKSIHSFEPAGLGGHIAVVTDDFNTGQMMAGSDFKVIRIVGRSNL